MAQFTAWYRTLQGFARGLLRSMKSVTVSMDTDSLSAWARPIDSITLTSSRSEVSMTRKTCCPTEALFECKRVGERVQKSSSIFVLCVALGVVSMQERPAAQQKLFLDAKSRWMRSSCTSVLCIEFVFKSLFAFPRALSSCRNSIELV